MCVIEHCRWLHNLVRCCFFSLLRVCKPSRTVNFSNAFWNSSFMPSWSMNRFCFQQNFSLLTTKKRLCAYVNHNLLRTMSLSLVFFFSSQLEAEKGICESWRKDFEKMHNFDNLRNHLWLRDIWRKKKRFILLSDSAKLFRIAWKFVFSFIIILEVAAAVNVGWSWTKQTTNKT